MYSIVMVAAMTAAPEAPDFFFHKGGGCNGGCHGWATGCNGCVGGCVGYGGCHGFGGGCHGGCFGGGHGHGHGFLGGCFFGGHGFLGHKSHGCWGNGCHGGCFGGCNGCVGGCHGCVGGCGGYAVPVAPMAVPAAPVAPATPGASPVVPMKVGYAPATGVPEAVATLPATRAQVVVRVPADAKLFADGQATQLAGTERVFTTPDLVAGRDFNYTLKVEYATGKSDSKQVVVRAGHRTVVEFAEPAAAEKATSPVTVTLPEKARLFVEGVETASTAGKHTFNTPELPKGKPFVYEFKAEVEKDGQTQTVTQKVTFNAGEAVVVDFSESATRTALK